MVSKDILGRLYSLRAGISLVSEEKRITDELIDDAKTKLDDAESEAASTLQSIGNNVKTHRERIAALQDSIDVKKKEKEENDSMIPILTGARKRCFVHAIVGFVICAVFIGLSIAVFYLIINVINADEWVKSPAFSWLASIFPGEKEGEVNLELASKIITAGFWVMIGAAVACTIVSIRKLVSAVGFKRSIISRSRENTMRTSKINEYTAKQNEAKHNLSNAQRKLDEYKASSAENISVAKKNFDEKKREAMIHAKAGVALINGLNESFSDLLDIRDWSNLDLVIFYLETRRVETISAALLHADQQNDMGKLIEAVNNASVEICHTINAGFGSLKSSVDKGFNQLSVKLSDIKDEISFAADRISSEISQANSYTSSLVSAVNLNNALQSKANVTSVALASDVASLRANTDYVADRLRLS